MRISKETAAYHDILWFACDNAGRIIMANSKEGNIPTFVVANESRAEQLAESLCGLHAIDRQRIPPIDYTSLAEKGFYCYINDDPYDGAVYRLCAKPRAPLTVDSLDAQTKELLLAQKLEIDPEFCNSFSVTD